jgi:hypothetical protein
MRMILILITALFTLPALAAGWSRYSNDRFGYSVDIPSGFSEDSSPVNGRDVSYSSASGNSQIEVWGLRSTGFSGTVSQLVSQSRGAGWQFGEGGTAVWSSWLILNGSKSGRLMYLKAIDACHGNAAVVRIEFDESDRGAIWPLLDHLGTSLEASDDC